MARLSQEEINALIGQLRQDESTASWDPQVWSTLPGLVQAESNRDPNIKSPVGAIGLTQLMPGTAKEMGVENPLDPYQNLKGGAGYLNKMLGNTGGDIEDALAGYNAGPGNLRKYGGKYENVPFNETKNYVPRVLKFAGLPGLGQEITDDLTEGGDGDLSHRMINTAPDAEYPEKAEINLREDTPTEDRASSKGEMMALINQLNADDPADATYESVMNATNSFSNVNNANTSPANFLKPQTPQSIKVPSPDVDLPESKLPTDDKGETPKKQGGFAKDILPMLLRFGLPTIAGLAIGGGSGLGALAGGLTGLTGGAMGYLNNKATGEGNQAKLDLKGKELKLKGLQHLSSEKQKNAQIAIQKYNADISNKNVDSQAAKRNFDKTLDTYKFNQSEKERIFKELDKTRDYDLDVTKQGAQEEQFATTEEGKNVRAANTITSKEHIAATKDIRKQYELDIKNKDTDSKVAKRDADIALGNAGLSVKQRKQFWDETMDTKQQDLKEKQFEQGVSEFDQTLEYKENKLEGDRKSKLLSNIPAEAKQYDQIGTLFNHKPVDFTKPKALEKFANTISILAGQTDLAAEDMPGMIGGATMSVAKGGGSAASIMFAIKDMIMDGGVDMVKAREIAEAYNEWLKIRESIQ